MAQHCSLPYANVIIVRLEGEGGTGGSEAVTGLDSRLIGLAWESVCSTASGADCTEDVHGF